MRFKHPRRNASSLTELVVAATLTVTVMSIIASLTVRCGRLWQDTRHQQLVMDELSNQLERLSSLPADQRDRALTQLAPSQHLRSALPSAEITAETIRDDHGVRLVLSLNWDRPGNPLPVTFVGWIDPLPVLDLASFDVSDGDRFAVARAEGETP
jgi:hypothetical protein